MITDAHWLAQEDALRPRVRLVDDLPLPPRAHGGFDVAYQDDQAFGASSSSSTRRRSRSSTR